MWKTVLAGTTALAIAGTTLAYAQQGDGGRDRMHHWRPSAEDIAAFGDARVAALHAGLELNADQQKLWPPVESALRDVFKQRSDWFTARASADRPTDPMERLNTRAQAMLDRGAALEEARRRRRPALQEPGRRPEAPLHRARPARRRARLPRP